MNDSPRICVQVESSYIASQSLPQQQRYVFAYTVTLRNPGRIDVRLLNRYWCITNGNGQVTEIQGEGVVGEQPYIMAGEAYQYSSGVILETPFGTMQGHYDMVDTNGNALRVEIPVFRLATPSLIH